MKILCLIDCLGSGGAQRQLVELAKLFKNNGDDVSFLTYHPDSFYLKTLEEAHVGIHCIIEPNYFRRFMKMRSYIRKGKYQVLLSFLEGSNFVATMSGFPARSWKTIVGERSANPHILRSPKQWLYRWLHLCADYVVSNSKTNIQLIKKINPFLSKGKCKVIYNLVDLDYWKPSTDYIPLRNGKLRLLIASSHQYIKNLKGLVEGVNNLTAEEKQCLIIDWYGDVSGDSSLEEARCLIKQYSLDDTFNFFPATFEIVEKMQEADVVGLFSLYEGLPNAICEGMAVGKPIIATNVSDIPFLLSKENGILCDPHDPHSIMLVIRKVLTMKMETIVEMGERSRRFALELFAKEVIFEKYKEIIIN